MQKIAQINFRRITLSFPKKTADLLRDRVAKNNMSKYVAGLIEGDLAEKDYKNARGFIEDLRNFRKSIKRKDKRSSLQILRKIRYGK